MATTLPLLLTGVVVLTAASEERKEVGVGHLLRVEPNNLLYPDKLVELFVVAKIISRYILTTVYYETVPSKRLNTDYFFLWMLIAVMKYCPYVAFVVLG